MKRSWLHIVRRGTRRRAFERETTKLIEDCQRLLAGRVLESLAPDQVSVPQWAWVNALAHGSETDLRLLASQPAVSPPWRPDLLRWGRAVSFLADELLSHAETLDLPIGELQHRLMVPIELQALSAPVSSSDLVRRVLGALVLVDHETRSEQRH